MDVKTIQRGQLLEQAIIEAVTKYQRKYGQFSIGEMQIGLSLAFCSSLEAALKNQPTSEHAQIITEQHSNMKEIIDSLVQGKLHKSAASKPRKFRIKLGEGK